MNGQAVDCYYSPFSLSNGRTCISDRSGAFTLGGFPSTGFADVMVQPSGLYAASCDGPFPIGSRGVSVLVEETVPVLFELNESLLSAQRIEARVESAGSFERARSWKPDLLTRSPCQLLRPGYYQFVAIRPDSQQVLQTLSVRPGGAIVTADLE